jgi:hypothetical protein
VLAPVQDRSDLLVLPAEDASSTASGRMTPTERAAIEQEATRRHAYAHGVFADPLYGLRRVRNTGWTVKGWDDTNVPTVFKRKRDAIVYAQKAAGECLRKAGELRAQLEAAKFSDEQAGITPEERQAAVRAEEAAIDGARWKRSA